MGDEAVKNTLVKMEKEFWAASGDGDYYREHFAEEGHCVFGFGVLDKAETIASVEGASPWATYDFADVAVTRIGDHVSVLAYSVRARRDGDGYDARVTSVYHQREDGWKLVHHQQTPAVPLSS